MTALGAAATSVPKNDAVFTLHHIHHYITTSLCCETDYKQCGEVVNCSNYCLHHRISAMKYVFRTDERPGRLSQLHLVNMTKFAVAAKYHDERCADAAPHRGPPPCGDRPRTRGTPAPHFNWNTFLAGES
jgi:hypothetical protein